MNHRHLMHWLIPALAAALMSYATGSPAQILPRVQLPELPVLPAEELNRTVDGVLRTADPRQLRELRRLRVQTLLEANRTVLETDPRGALILRKEVIALSPSQAALDQAQAAGFGVGRTRSLEGLDTTIVVLQAPPGMSTRRALQTLRQADPQGVYDYNHVYTDSGEASPTAPPAAPTAEAASLAQLAPDRTGPRHQVGHEDHDQLGKPGAAPGARVGLIDGGVQRAHVVFRDIEIHEHGCAGGNIPSAHGTAVASLIVGRTERFHGAVPGAELYAADVYCGLATGGAVDAVADAFAWLSRERVPVINISLVGPANGLLEQIIRIVTARGHVVVAAVGNDGPSAAPLFPAAYPDVVAVTGVDAKKRVLLEACRGKHVDFAAPGSDMSAAGTESEYGLVRGTSFAAPIVAGLLAQRIDRLDRQQAQAALNELTSQAVDLGARGRDKVYGDGLIGEALRPPESLANLTGRPPAYVK